MIVNTQNKLSPGRDGVNQVGVLTRAVLRRFWETWVGFYLNQPKLERGGEWAN